MNVVILPGVHLWPRTIVGEGSIVTKSFSEGFCVKAGNPARIIKSLDKDIFVTTKFKTEFYGDVPKERFPIYAKRHLKNNKYFNQIIDSFQIDKKDE